MTDSPSPRAEMKLSECSSAKTPRPQVQDGAPKADLLERLEAARAEVAGLEREAAQGPCRQFGHAWRHIGGCNAGCGLDCACSVPVHECAKCGDCDYGHNIEAEEMRRHCAEMRP